MSTQTIPYTNSENQKKQMWVILCEFLYKSIVHLVRKKHNEQIWFISIELHVQVGSSLFW